MSIRGSTRFILAALILSGCSPFGRKSEPKTLFPADSLSRLIAQSVTPELLKLDWRVEGGEGSYFSSIASDSSGIVWVGDLGRHTVRRFTSGGEELESIDGFSFPYLAGRLFKTVAVYDAGTNRIEFIDEPDKGLDLPPVAGEATGLARQVALLNGTAFLKDARPPTAVIHRLDAFDPQEPLVRLPGPAWHHNGVLRPWRDVLISASSYRPILLTIDRTGRIDSLHLEGFDSPMLARSRSFSLGELDEPPLMISGIYGTDSELYVINVRPGILRIDIFDAAMRLQRILQLEEPEPTGFTAVDLVVEVQHDTTFAFVASVNTVYGSLSLQYASRLDRFVIGTEE